MSDRVLDISEQPARLSVENSLLVLQMEGRDAVTVPLAEIAVLIASHPRISLTHAVVSGLAEAGAIFVSCDSRRRPVSMMLPLITHSLQAERFSAQMEMPLPARKRIWRQIVRAKLMAQGKLLTELKGQDHGLAMLASHVRSGDPQNLEAQAARRYWSALFGKYGFRRHADDDAINACLNYGYAVLRGIASRALCGAGLHPCLGVHHHNRYNPFGLADDLMEPFRPVVDRAVFQLCEKHGKNLQLDRDTRQFLLAALLGRFVAEKESRTLFDWVTLSSESLARAILGEREKLDIPGL
jgi:CRISPR-associated protein Cas1